jgi:hypothetical protein
MAANALTDFSRIDRRHERDPFGWERVKFAFGV